MFGGWLGFVIMAKVNRDIRHDDLLCQGKMSHWLTVAHNGRIERLGSFNGDAGSVVIREARWSY